MRTISFKRGDWPAAIKHYTDAISGALRIEKKNALLPALLRNRSSAHFANKAFQESLKDAVSSLKVDPKSSKVTSLFF